MAEFELQEGEGSQNMLFEKKNDSNHVLERYFLLSVPIRNQRRDHSGVAEHD